MYNWFSFALNVSVLVAIIPVMVLKALDVRKSIFLGGFLITAAQLLAYFMITTDMNYKSFRDNSATIVLIVSLLGGQGACLVLFALMQSLLESTTVLCCHFVCGLLIGYFYVSKQMFGQLYKSDLFGSFKNLSLVMIIGGAIACFVASRVMANSGDDDETGLLGRAASLSKGIVNRRTSKGFILIQFALACALAAITFLDWEEYKFASILVLVLWILNIIVPIYVLLSLDEESMR